MKLHIHLANKNNVLPFTAFSSACENLKKGDYSWTGFHSVAQIRPFFFHSFLYMNCIFLSVLDPNLWKTDSL